MSTTLPIIIYIQYWCSLVNYIHIDLRGVDVLARTTVIVTNSPQTFHWVGYGFKLTIPQGSLPDGVDQCRLDIKASVTAWTAVGRQYRKKRAVLEQYSALEFDKDRISLDVKDTVTTSGWEIMALYSTTTNCKYTMHVQVYA